MANNKQRYVNTRFWNDTYVSVLDPIEKLLFIYLLTNEHTNISGVYELPFKIMAVETGIDESMFKKIMPRLKDRIRYVDGYIVIKNFLKHQETKSNLTLIGIKNCLKDLDENFLKDIVNKGYYLITDEIMEGVCKGYARVSNYSNSNSNLDSNSIGDKSQENPIKTKKPVYTKNGAEVLKAFEDIDAKNKTYYANKTQRSACDFLIETYGFSQVISLIPKLKETNKKSVYQITTPWEMKEKITKVFNDVSRLSDTTKSKNTKYYG